VTELSVAIDGYNAGVPTTVKGSIYTDNMGSPGKRIAVSAKGISTDKRQWISMHFENSVTGTDGEYPGVYLGSGFYWIAVSVDKAANFLGFPSSTEGTEGMLQLEEGFKPGNTVPSLDFNGEASPATVGGSFSVHASMTNDYNVNVYPDAKQPCPSATTCDECMRTEETRQQYLGHRCAWAAEDEAVTGCQPIAYLMVNGYQEDMSCHTSWGQGMFVELEHWYCEGEAGFDAFPVAAAQPDTEEECAQACKLANTAWYKFSKVPGGTTRELGDLAAAAFYCKGFTYDPNPESPSIEKCMLYKDFTNIVPTVEWEKVRDADDKLILKVTDMKKKCFVQKELPNICQAGEGTEWFRDQDGVFFYTAKNGFMYQVQKTADGGMPRCDGGSVFGGDRQVPRKFCNGFQQNAEQNERNPPDPMCSKCVAHSLQHNLLAGLITGGTDSGGCSALAMHHVVICPNTETKDKLKCPVGSVIHINPKGAKYGRSDKAIVCNANNPPKMRNEKCGIAGNANYSLESCKNKQFCSVVVADMIAPNCAEDLSLYLEVSFRCI